jgi:exodeoxyribonuclease VII large subunit
MTSPLRANLPLFNERVSPSDTTLSVSELVARAKRAVEQALPLLWVSGEISGFKRATSGHCYFALKDETAQAPCVLYRQKSARVPVALQDGLAVELRVLATMYTPRGEFQLQVEEVRLAGVGVLYEAFARLKAKLDAEGLFDAQRKRALPPFPKAVGLITSASGAVLHDMVTTLRARWPAIGIVLYPSVVQGASAPASLIAALNAANTRKEVDVLIIGRGGGSMEDLWAFNDEGLAREIANSALPIVSAVGHETDFTIADFVADVRAATPTYAASLVVPDAREWTQRLDGAWNAIQSAQRFHLRAAAQRIALVRAKLAHPRERLIRQRDVLRGLAHRLQRVQTGSPQRDALSTLQQRMQRARPDITMAMRQHQDLERRLTNASGERLTAAQQRTSRAAQALALLAPHRVLERGYAWITLESGQVVSSAAQLDANDAIAITLADGQADATVTRVRKRLL